MDQLLDRSSNNDRASGQLPGNVESRGNAEENIEIDFNARVIETSSESGESDSNGSDNDEHEIDEEGK